MDMLYIVLISNTPLGVSEYFELMLILLKNLLIMWLSAACESMLYLQAIDLIDDR